MQPRIDRHRLTFVLLAWLGGATVCFAQDVASSGYLVLGHLIQKLTGKSYETFLRENIFTPLGMKDSALDSRSVIVRRAGSYTVTPSGLVNASYASDRIVPNTGAGLYSTTEDLMRWQNGLYGGKVISKASLQKMTTPFEDDYGLGVYIRAVDGRRAATHIQRQLPASLQATDWV